ncbi:MULTISPECIES: response regulator [Pedobacter]|uniref:Sensory/regulatory protein RpfC n=1 Tax=Pedobacter heparinus (strain ATCC 13125 / DSM 2366 / CIP 104194 / JCM 7457 / NBRC 12017 / NCIMB 9290 / NRRL B-14731 / HIM 762-3) TaxID=485917 RepID=C6Y0P6_PEDHD|nr:MULTISPECIES: response regulator [Pedobacter]ACU02807.1 ATP-binding region ATPase domain protein [Pedobacter heparinus DSM 2366]MBB5438197.1 signal transduction histidine kinase [Pedobacter sp. AK017]
MEKINILIVDDRPENIIALEALLQRNDINIISTTNPNEALRLSWEMDIAIAMIDVQMPEMDGFELVEILKSNPRTKEILIIFVTAISKETKYAVKGLSTGAVDYLYKPLDPYVTAAKVDSFIQFIRNQREVKKKNKELEAYQKELIKAKELAETGKRIKDNFLANMSHEIRTPINGIIGIAQLLKKTELTDEQREMVNLLEISSNSLLGVINDVLDLSKIESGKFKINRTATDIIKICESVVDLLRIPSIEKKLDLKLALDSELPKMILADSLRLNQILMNLIGNAIKFTHQGSVTLKVEILNRKGNNLQLRFSVADTGIGIAKENIDKIFETFEQADEQTTIKFGGTGLGLSIVKNLAKLKGGTLEVISEENIGSTFSFSNWYEVLKDADVPEKQLEEKLMPFKNLNILVAEDNPINKFLIIKILQNWEVQLEVVENGQQALDKLREKHYDLILMDTFMPVMNGLEAIRLIREGYAPGKENIPIITFSAAVLDTDKETAIAAGANDVISKPFEPAVLYKKIQEYTIG